MSAALHFGSIVCLGVGVGNLAWVDLVLLPAVLDARDVAATSKAPSAVAALDPARDQERGADLGSVARDGTAAPGSETLRGETSGRPGPSAAAPVGGAVLEPEATVEVAGRTEPGPEEPSPPPPTLPGERMPTPTVDPVPSVRGSVRFAFGSAALGPRARRRLDRLVAPLCTPRGCEGSVEIDGHTDPSGPRAVNLALSEARAETVRRILLRRGFRADSLHVRAHGPDQPPDADRGWAARRRVDVVGRSER